MPGSATTCPSAPTPAVVGGSVTNNSFQVSFSSVVTDGTAVPITFLLNVYGSDGITPVAGYPAAGITVTSPYTINFLTGGLTYNYKITAVGACNKSTTGSPPTTLSAASIACVNSYSTTAGFVGGLSIPVGCTSVAVRMTGGSGGSYSAGAKAGGFGGTVSCTLPVVGGSTTLNVYVGGPGSNGVAALTSGSNRAGGALGAFGTGGSNGGNGGTGGSSLGNTTAGGGGGGGGGSSEIRINSTLASATAICAGGGGGGSDNAVGGNGGATLAQLFGRVLPGAAVLPALQDPVQVQQRVVY